MPTILLIGFPDWYVARPHVNAHKEIVNLISISVLSVCERIIPGMRPRRNARVGFRRLIKQRKYPNQLCRYYLQRCADNETVQTLPDGLRILTGNTYARSYAGTPESQAITWNWLVTGLSYGTVC